MDFEEEMNKLLAEIPKERQTFLFSATMTSKVAKLQRASCVRSSFSLCGALFCLRRLLL